LGFWGAGQSRYTTFDLLILVGLYMTVLGRPTLFSHDSKAIRVPTAGEQLGSHRWSWLHGWIGHLAEYALLIGRWIVVGVISIQALLGLVNGMQGVDSVHKGQVQAVQVSRTIDQSSNDTVQSYLEPFLPASYIRQQIRIAERLHLSLFAGTSAT
jgi:hypothetical protein